MYDVEKLRSEFPILNRKIGERPLIYLDNTATSQTPACVVEEIERGYETAKANVHRGVHTLSQIATERQEHTRSRIRDWLNADTDQEIIFTRGTTEAINLVASSFGQLIPRNGEIILTVMEHHANIVPWQLLQRHRPDIKIKVVDIDDRGVLDQDQYRSLFNPHTALASFCHISNVLGTVNPVEEMVSYAHSQGVPCMVDGAQAVPHMRVDVRKLDCDFYAFSSHKMYGPSGLGVLYGKRKWLEEMPPYQGGGEMIQKVSFEGTTFAELPFKFEAGTPDFIDIAAFSATLDFLDRVGLDTIKEHEDTLLREATRRLEAVPGLKIYGNAPHKCALISFLVEGVHPYDLGMLLDQMGVAVRTGHHCAQPLMDRLGIPGTVRASFAAYNTLTEVGAFSDALERVLTILR